MEMDAKFSALNSKVAILESNLAEQEIRIKVFTDL